MQRKLSTATKVLQYSTGFLRNLLLWDITQAIAQVLAILLFRNQHNTSFLVFWGGVLFLIYKRLIHSTIELIREKALVGNNVYLIINVL